MPKENFFKFVQSTLIDGDRKALDYTKALDSLSKIITVIPLGFNDCKNIWAIDSLDRLYELAKLVSWEKRKGEDSLWNINGTTNGYLQSGEYSAALRYFGKYLVEENYQQRLWRQLKNNELCENELTKDLDITLNYPDFLIDKLDNTQADSILRLARKRSIQMVFEKNIFSIYQNTCCVTGLNIAVLNRATRIISSVSTPIKQLDPANGLCLSATYDVAFSEKLISLDDDYRLIISKNLGDFYTGQSVREYFIKKEGASILLPNCYPPNRDYLEEHRSLGEF